MGELGFCWVCLLPVSDDVVDRSLSVASNGGLLVVWDCRRRRCVGRSCGLGIR